MREKGQTRVRVTHPASPHCARFTGKEALLNMIILLSNIRTIWNESRFSAFVLSKFLAPFCSVTFCLSLWLLYFLILQPWVDPPASVFFLGPCSALLCGLPVAMLTLDPRLPARIPSVTHQGLISGGNYCLPHENI